MEKPAVDTSSGVPQADKDIFKEVFFTVIASKNFSGDKVEQITEHLTSHGGTKCPLDDLSELRYLTHVIAIDSDFRGYHECVDAYIHVVRPSWVQQSLYKNKAANPRQFSPDPAFFLQDVVITCAGDIPEGDKDAIVGGLHSMGGQYSPGLSRLVTHVVALTINQLQAKTVAEKNLKCKFVLPHWFDDCLKLGKMISHDPYLLPNPPILSGSFSKPLMIHDASADIDGATLLTPPPLPDSLTPPASPSKERRELNVFRNRTIFLHKDLGLGSRLSQSLTDIVKQGAGSIVIDFEEADTLICQYRDSPEFMKAYQSSMDIGNLSWLYYLINHNEWTSPTRRLLHFPFPRNGIEGFQNYRIAVSNYTGEARIYLESLIQAAGGNYTKAMSADNTHLITAHTASEKCVAAREWQIQVVNHIWLEESYASCRVMAVTYPKYTRFPEKTNLCEVIGRTTIDRKAIEKHISLQEQNPTSGGHLEPLEMNSNITRTPAAKGSKFDNKEKEKQTPITTGLMDNLMVTPGSRGAKDRALSKLHSMASDIALFEKETKRVGGVVYGGRRVGDPDRITLNSAPTGRKRLSTERDAEILPDRLGVRDSEEPVHAAPPPKKKIKASKPVAVVRTNAPVLKVVITGYDKPGLKATSTIKAKLAGLNLNIVEDPTADINVLAAAKMMRTRKFLTAVAAAPAIVNVDWLEDMAKQQKRLPVEDYALKDPDTERTVGFTLNEALTRAKRNKENGGMLKDYTIFCTDSVKTGFDTYDSIVKANGGTCLLFKGRPTTIPTGPKKRSKQQDEDVDMDDADDDADEDEDADGDAKKYLYLITDVNPKDKPLWPKFREMAIAQGYTPRVVKPDWLLRIAQSQDVEDWQDEWEFV